ncbi:hypothetical protein ACFOWE_07135 [Planomonospora corallina]|uniref:Lipoprotein n=1 Tax=Planomonospora corallina TaxID=1806052 RepID=A0ABV8I6L7_9ACTN
MSRSRSRSRRGFPVRLGATLSALALLAAACGEREPTAAEAGETLKTHVMALLKERGALNVRVTDPGGKDIPCGEGKAKRTFAATGEDASPETEAGVLDDALVGALGHTADYDLVDAVEKPLRLRNPSARTLLTLASVTGRYVVRGETECLSRS